MELQNGRRGRPQKSVCLNFLTEAITNNSRHINLSELTRILGISRMTLWRTMRKHGLKRSYTLISDDKLDVLVKAFKKHKPDSGFRYLLAHLWRHGIRVQQKRIWRSLRRVDRLGQRLRQCRTIQRRVYHVARSNALWHVDRHHKLIRWGFVIHGIVDGYCRMVCIHAHWHIVLLTFLRSLAYEQVRITVHQRSSTYSSMQKQNMVCRCA